MTSTAIPQANAALLAAQSKEGQAGVAAYQQAQQALAAQKAAASAAAMQGQAAAGAPAGAMQAAMADTNAMYDERAATLTTAQAALQDSLHSRNARMLDYNAAVNEARGLISSQVDLAIAPINAQSRYNIAGIEAQGRQAVDQIEAKRRLQELEMEAAAQAAMARGGGGRGGGGGGGGGGSTKKKSINEGELSSSLARGAQEKANKILGQVQQGMRQTTEQARQATSYAGRAAQEWAQKNGAGGINLSAAEAARQAASYSGRSAQQSAAAAAGSNLPAGSPAQAAMEAAARAARRASEDAAARYAAQVNQRNATVGMAAARSVAPAWHSDTSLPALTAAQMEQFGQGPLADMFNAMVAGGSPLRRFEGTDDGRTNSIANIAGQHGNNAQARQFMEEGAWATARELAEQGYDIDNAAVLNAIKANETWKPGTTLADFESRIAGGDSVDEEIAKAIEQDDRRLLMDARERSDMTEAQIKRAADDFQIRYNVTPSDLNLSDEDVAVFADEYGELIDGVIADADNLVRNGMNGEPLTADQVMRTLREAYNPADPDPVMRSVNARLLRIAQATLIGHINPTEPLENDDLLTDLLGS